MSRPTRRLLTILVLLTLAYATLWSFGRIILAAVTPCASEDSTVCYWDATSHGNGIGHSFIDLGGLTLYL